MDKSGLSRWTVSNVLGGRKGVNLETLCKIAEVLDTTVSELTRETNEENINYFYGDNHCITGFR